jgi:TRAP-type C4-dicarboxylate transport system permease small subunit
MAPFGRFLTRIEDAFMVVVSISLASIMLITVVDVVSRYALNAPLGWAYDVITEYLLVAAFFLSLSYVMRIGGHMGLDFLVRRAASPPIRNVASLVGDLLTFLMGAGMFYGGLMIAWSAWQGGDVITGAVEFPTWPSRVLVPIGAGVFCLRMLHRMGCTLEAWRRGVAVQHFFPLSH